MQSHLSTCHFRTHQTLCSLHFDGKKKKMFQHSAFARDLSHLLELVWGTTLPHKRKRFIVRDSSVPALVRIPEWVNDERRGTPVCGLPVSCAECEKLRHRYSVLTSKVCERTANSTHLLRSSREVRSQGELLAPKLERIQRLPISEKRNSEARLWWEPSWGVGSWPAAELRGLKVSKTES